MAAASSSSSAESEKRAARDEPLREAEWGIRPGMEGEDEGAGEGEGEGGLDRWLRGLRSRVEAGRSWV